MEAPSDLLLAVAAAPCKSFEEERSVEQLLSELSWVSNYAKYQLSLLYEYLYKQIYKYIFD